EVGTEAVTLHEHRRNRVLRRDLERSARAIGHHEAHRQVGVEHRFEKGPAARGQHRRAHWSEPSSRPARPLSRTYPRGIRPPELSSPPALPTRYAPDSGRKVREQYES